MSAQDVATVLLRNPALSRLCTQARLLIRAQSCLDRTLPADIAPHCRVAAIHDDSLTLHAESPAWAARLRYLGPDILHALRSDPALPAIRTVRAKSVPRPLPVSRKTKRPGLSPRTVQLLRDVAGSIQDPGLREVLLRLSRR